MPPTLLLADDSVTVQRVIELTFANEDVRVVAMSDGLAAVQRIDAEPPDIVLADVGMSKLDGYDVASHIKKNPALRSIPVLLLTGAFEPVDEDRARASGCDGILVKPFEPQALIGRVKELLAGKRSPALWPANLPRVEAAAPVPVPTRVASPVPDPEPAPRAVPPPQVFPAAVPPPVTTASVLRMPQAPAPATPPSKPIVAPLPVPPPVFRPPAPVAAPGSVPPAPPARTTTANPALEVTFEREFDQLDAAFAELEPHAPAAIDDETASDFARDLDLFRGSGEPDGVGRALGDWDLPKPPPQAQPVPDVVVPRASAPSPAWSVETDGDRRAPREASVAERAVTPPEAPPTADLAPVEKAASTTKLSMATAFSALLAAEQSQPTPPRRPVPPELSEAAVEDVVRRVLTRMTDETVRKIVLDTAERLIREEIEKTKHNT